MNYKKELREIKKIRNRQIDSNNLDVKPTYLLNKSDKERKKWNT